MSAKTWGEAHRPSLTKRRLRRARFKRMRQQSRKLEQHDYHGEAEQADAELASDDEYREAWTYTLPDEPSQKRRWRRVLVPDEEWFCEGRLDR